MFANISCQFCDVGIYEDLLDLDVASNRHNAPPPCRTSAAEIDSVRYPNLAKYLRWIIATAAFQQSLVDELPFVDQMGLKRVFLSAA